MESSTSPESFPSDRIQAIEELTRGRELMNILDETLWWPKSLEFDYLSEDGLVAQIQSMFENTLSAMSSHNFNETSRFMANDSHILGSCQLNEHKAKHSDQSLMTRKPVKTRRKNSWTSTQVSSALVDDGHVWRKYGQKRIQTENFHRSYYRCTYKYDQRCQATKQVQMIQENPPKYRTTYIGNHTCKNLLRPPQIILDTSHGSDSSILISFEANGQLVEKKHFDHNFGAIKHEFKEEFPAYTNDFRDHSPSSSNSESNYLLCDPNVCVSEQPLEQISITSKTNLHVELGSQLIQQLQTNCYYYTL